MKYRFIGKPDAIFPGLKTGKVYDLEIQEVEAGLFGGLVGITKPYIIRPIRCPYSSWESFHQNWKREIEI